MVKEDGMKAGYTVFLVFLAVNALFGGPEIRYRQGLEFYGENAANRMELGAGWGFPLAGEAQMSAGLTFSYSGGSTPLYAYHRKGIGAFAEAVFSQGAFSPVLDFTVGMADFSSYNSAGSSNQAGFAAACSAGLKWKAGESVGVGISGGYGIFSGNDFLGYPMVGFFLDAKF